MNFNLSNKPDYKLQASHTHELINLYGVQVKILLVTRINEDDLVFGDYSHLKTDSNKSFEIYGLPESVDEWDNIGTNFSQFGMLNLETINLFFSRKTFDTIWDDLDGTNGSKGFGDIIGNLIVLPNNRIVEITEVQYEVPGISNLYTQQDQKNVYKCICKTYDMKIVNEINPADISAPGSTEDYTQLDDYFTELSAIEVETDNEAEIVTSVEQPKPILDTTEDNVFGKF